MQIRLNGQPFILAAPATVADLLVLMNVAGKRIAVEHNGEIVPRSQHGTTPIAEGDQFEIVVAVGGG